MIKDNVQVIIGASFASTYITPFFEDGDGFTIGMAICGSLVYVMNTKELSIISRIINVILASFIGYALANTVATNELPRSIIAFVGAVASIAVSIKLLEFIRSEDFFKEITHFILKILGRDK